MAILTRKSVMAVKEETTEGTPVAPTASTDYFALQDDLTLTPEFETLENAELKDSLGIAKAIQGQENPSGSLSHYLRHSGTEGAAPNYGPLLKSIFGSEDVAATEYDTVGGSTTTTIEVDAGEGAFFQRGQALLVKHPTFPYEIAVVESVAGDTLTLLFELANAPAAATPLGKAVTYLPGNDPMTGTHPTLTLWHYVGNGGAIQMVAGTRVTSLAATFESGQLINGSYTFEGLEYFFNPLEVEAGVNDDLDFTDDGGTFVATMTAGVYKKPDELATEIAKQLNAAGTETFTVTYSSTTGKFTISNTSGATLSLLWDTGVNSATTIGSLIGFDTAADDTGSTSYEGDNAIDLGAPQSPTFDSEDPNVAKSNELWLGDQDDGQECVRASNVAFNLDVPKVDIGDICAESGRSGSLPNSRTATLTISALLEQYDTDRFCRFKDNDNIRLQYNYGKKTAGNWDAGSSGALSVPTGTVTEFEIVDDEGLATLNITVQAYVNDAGDGEVYLSFV